VSKILAITQKEPTGITYYRHNIPHRLLEMEVVECPIGVDAIENIPDEKLKEFSAVFFMRHISVTGKTKSICERLKGLGLKVIFDMDDYWHLPPSHHLYTVWDKNKVGRQTIEAFIHSDVVLTTTPKMYNQIKVYNSNCYVLFNSLFEEEKQLQKREIKNKRVRFGWVGGVYHYADIKMIQNTFKLISANKELLKDIQICLGGYTEGQKEYRLIEQIMTNNYSYLDESYKEYLLSGIRMGEHITYNQPYRRLHSKGVYEYIDIYNDIDVALIPLENNPFNTSKSNLKVVEAGYMGKAVIASDVYPYTIDCDKTNSILVSDNKYGWYEAILQYMDKTKREEQATWLNEKIRSRYNILLMNEQRERIYKTLLA
jgi:glycosyltransferase involved in cell wall biosynthesis